MSLYKLGLRNVRTQFYYYFMYCISMTFANAIFYIFTAMQQDELLTSLTLGSFKIDFVLKAATVLITVFIILFMFSVNNFFISRRKQEIGLYNLLGMRRYQIGILFFVENLIIGSIAMILGLLSGILLSKLFIMILLKVMEINAASYIILSVEALSQTVISFGLILLVVSLRASSLVYHHRLIDLFKSSQRSQGGKIRLKRLAWFGLTSLLTFLVLAYFFYNSEVLRQDILRFGLRVGFNVSVIIITLIWIFISYVFFYLILVCVIFFIRQKKMSYYRDINMLVINQLSFNLNRNIQSLSMIFVFLCSVFGLLTLSTVYKMHTEEVTNTYYVTYDAYQDQKQENHVTINDPRYIVGNDYTLPNVDYSTMIQTYQKSSQTSQKRKELLGVKSYLNENRTYFWLQYNRDLSQDVQNPTRFYRLKISGKLIMYVGTFTGLLFMLSTASIIMMKQLSDNEEQRENYCILIKLGVSKKIIKNSIYKQNAITFFIPLIVAFTCHLFLMKFLFDMVPTPNFTIIFILLFFLIVMYVLFYLLTSYYSYQFIINATEAD